MTCKLTFVAFFADCQYQVQPVKTGYRVALTYNLIVEGRGGARRRCGARSGPARGRRSTGL